MRDLRVKEMTTAGIFGAIILFMSLVPAPWGLTWGFIRISGGIEITIIHIPVIIGGIFGGKRVAITLGGIFAPFFYNPLVSILPRVLFGYFIYLFYTGINKVVKNQYASMVLSMGLSTFAHSIMVLTMLYLFSFNSDTYLTYFGSDSIIQFMLAILGLNAVIEITIAVLVGTPIGLRIKEFKEQE